MTTETVGASAGSGFKIYSIVITIVNTNKIAEINFPTASVIINRSSVEDKFPSKKSRRHYPYV